MSNENIEILRKAFDEFNKSTSYLAKAYEELKKKASEIDKELQEKNILLEERNRQLKHTTRFLDSVIKSMNSALIAIDGKGIIKTANPLAYNIFGIKQKNIEGKNINDIAELKNIVIFYKNTLEGKIFNAKEVLLNIEGKDTPLLAEISTSRMVDKNSLLGVLIIVRDLTQVKELRESVIRNENLAMLGKMAVSVAHEIRNPLGGVEGFAALLKKDLNDDPSKRELAEKIIIGTRDVNSFINNLLDFARPLKVVKKKERFSSIVEKAIDFSLKHPIGAVNKVKIRRIYDDDFEHKVDGQLIFRMLLNILINAYEAMNGTGICKIGMKKIENIKKLKHGDKVIKSINYREGQPFFLFYVKDKGRP